MKTNTMNDQTKKKIILVSFIAFFLILISGMLRADETMLDSTTSENIAEENTTIESSPESEISEPETVSWDD